MRDQVPDDRAATIAIPPIVGVPAFARVRVLDRPVVADLLADPPLQDAGSATACRTTHEEERGAAAMSSAITARLARP